LLGVVVKDGKSAMKLRVLLLSIVLSLGFLIGSVRLQADDHQPPQPWSLDQSAVSAQLKAFIAAKEAQARALAKSEGKELSPEYATFFAAVANGDSQSVSNFYERLLPGTEWQPALETCGALWLFANGNEKYAIAFGQDIIKSIPPGSVYFGMTDPGRFLITALSTSQINGNPFFTITPKFFSQTKSGLINPNDNLDYLRSMYGRRLKIPSEQEVQRCIQEYTDDLQLRVKQGVTNADESVVGAMTLDAQIAKLIFDQNPDREFYVEESFVIPWMYPYLEPHGLILKLNRTPLTRLDPAVVAKDREFWDRLTKKLLADPMFLNHRWARQAYSKLRSAIGGLYAYGRGLNDEAEYAFKQAISLDPANPEASFRLAQLYTEQNRFDEAIATIKSLQQLDPGNEKLQAAISQMQTMKQSGLRTTGWLMGPSFFRQGDSIIITDVRSSSPKFTVGDTVKVTGRYTLSSKPKALLCLHVTASSKGDGWEPDDAGQELQVAQGSGEFVLSEKITEAGHLHLTFYDAYSGNPFGGFYFGTDPQIREIADWHVKDWYAKE
jgi:tetratricopeptide (TPR) repeat protein